MGTELMNPNARELGELDRAQCLQLLASVPIGRIVYTEQALPAIQLVNFRLAKGTIVIRTARGSKLAAAARHAILGFEADRYDERSSTGWSVTAIGHSWVVEEPDEIAFLDTLALRPWAPGPRDHYIQISPERLIGRQVTATGSANLTGGTHE
jgi:hypothetical protein